MLMNHVSWAQHHISTKIVQRQEPNSGIMWEFHSFESSFDLVSLNAAMMHNIAFPVPGISRPNHTHAYTQSGRLNDGELGGGDVESIDISGEAGESLL
jgi:hypothetical protein